MLQFITKPTKTRKNVENLAKNIIFNPSVVRVCGGLAYA
jgi:hypothetical protein